MNVFRFKDFTVILDYAHNTHGLQAIGKFIHTVPASKKVGLITAVGDRRDVDIVSLGVEAAKIFDEIIIRQDRHMRGRDPEEMINLLKDGIFSIKPDAPITIIPQESEAIAYALGNAIKDQLLVIVSEVIPDSLDLVKSYKEKEDQELIQKSNALL